MKKSYRLYILVRSDLPSMNPGRGMAQAAHAANQFTYEYDGNKDVEEWQASAKGFGTTICLSADKSEIKEIIKKAKKWDLKCGLVYDPTYKYTLDIDLVQHIPSTTYTADPIFSRNGLVTLFRNEITCGYLFLEEGSPEQKSLVGALPLHP